MRRRVVMFALLAIVVAWITRLPSRTPAGTNQPSPAPVNEVSSPLAARVQALASYVDVLSSGGFDAMELAKIEGIGARSGTGWLVIARATLQMDRITRGATMIKSSPAGMFFPMDSIAVDPAKVGDTMGAAVATVLSRGDIVMSRTSASVEGADVGDTIDLRGWDGSQRSLVVGAVVDDSLVVNAELVLGEQLGVTMGVSRPSRVRYFGSRARLATAVAALPHGIRSDPSWLGSSAEESVSQARTKQLLGEFAYARRPSGEIVIDPAWKAAHLVTERFPLIGTIECNRVVATAAIAALDEVRQAGLAWLIDTGDTYRNGGCFGPREQRAADGTSGRTLSRHSWGGALDINPSANPQGAKPKMDRRLINIFSRHGFVWGGNFPTPDGMHFEYAGP